MTTKRRPSRIFWILGLALLLATAIGAGVVLNPTQAGNQADTVAAGFDVVSLGHVDVEQGVTPLNPSQAGKVCQVAFERGLLVETSGSMDEVVKLLPPLTISDEELDLGIDLLSTAIDTVGGC